MVAHQAALAFLVFESAAALNAEWKDSYAAYSQDAREDKTLFTGM
jgi:hypothetical protein